jgi:septal ring-binding cell division protein DamX
MSYELSQTPEELPARPAASISPAAPAEVESAVAFRHEAPAVVEERFASRVANARPISSTPPELRDTTREIENEARRAEYRQPRLSSRGAGETASPPSVDVREGGGAVKGSIATRPIGMSGAAGAGRNDGEFAGGIASAFVIASQERKSADVVAKAGPVVNGVSPIGPPPESADRSDRKNPAAGDDVVESRLAATREWLSAAPQTMHTIQIMGTNSEEQLKNQLRAWSKILEPQKIYVFRTYAQGKPAMTVVYGGYADRHAALQALEKLPPSVSANRPVLRTLNGIRSELKQHGIKAES